MSSIAEITNSTGTSFSHTFHLSPTPTTASFLAHPDLRVPSIVALSFLLLASVRRAGKMIITERNWSFFRRWSWFGLRREAGGEEDDEKRLRFTEAGEEGGRGVGGLRGVERWRGKMFGAGGEDMGGQRDQGRLIVTYIVFLFFFCTFTIWSLLSFRPTDNNILCGIVGVISFLTLGGARYVALVKITLDLELARGGRRAGIITGEAARKWEVYLLRGFLVVGIIMSTFSAIFSRGLLRNLPSPFNDTALCFRRSFLLYAIPLGLDLLISLYTLCRLFIISHCGSSWWTVLKDGRIQRASIFSLWIMSTFVQEMGVGEMTGSEMWLPVCLGAWSMMAVMESRPFIPPPPPAPLSTPQPYQTSRSSSVAAEGGIGPHHNRNLSSLPPFSFLILDGRSAPPTPKISSNHRPTESDASNPISETDAKAHHAFRQEFNTIRNRRLSEDSEYDDNDIVNEAATEPSTVFHAPNCSSPVTVTSEDEGSREMMRDDDQDRAKSSPSLPADRLPPVPRDGRIQTLLPLPAHPRRLSDSTILDQETTAVLHVSQRIYTIPRPFTPSTQGNQTTTSDSHFFSPTPLPVLPPPALTSVFPPSPSRSSLLPEALQPSAHRDPSIRSTQTARTFGKHQPRGHKQQDSSIGSINTDASDHLQLRPSSSISRLRAAGGLGLPRSPKALPATPEGSSSGREEAEEEQEGHGREGERERERGPPTALRIRTYDFSLGKGEVGLGKFRF